MLTLKYTHEASPYQVTFKKINSTTVQLNGEFPIQATGFYLYKDHLLLGDYTAYKTIYRTLDNGVQFSCGEAAASALPPASPPDAANNHN